MGRRWWRVWVWRRRRAVSRGPEHHRPSTTGGDRMSADLLALMNQTITIETPATLSGSGEVATWNPAVSYRCQLTGQRRITFTAFGQQVVSGMTAIFCSGDPFDTRSRVTLSTGDIGSTEAHLRQPAIGSVHRYSDDGFEIVEMLLAGGVRQ